MVPISDTMVIIKNDIPYKIKRNQYKKSQAFYDSVYLKTHKNRISEELYKLALSHQPEQEQSSISGTHEVAKNPFEESQGKTIRNIRFVQVDILEGSIEDTLKSANSGFAKILNNTHIQTHDWILKKFMLVESGDQIIPGILADNERIIRDIPAIEDVSFWVIPDTLLTDIVDLIVVTKDIFPIGATASASSFDRFNARLWDNNALGLASELGGKIMYDSFFKNPWGYEIYSKYRNYLGTFIDGSILWRDAYDAKWLTLGLSKNFQSPQTKYGGGINIGWIRDKYEISSGDSLITGMFETNYQDFWLGRSFLLGDKSSRNNLIVSARFERKEYMLRPFTSPDSNISFQNRNIYYGKIGYSRLNYYKASMIKSYGIFENIPYGINTGLTVAYINSDYLHRTYLGYSFGAGKYFEKFGYFAGNIIIGGLYNNGNISQGLFESNFLYYTPLLKINRYSTRSFLRFRYQETISLDINKTVDFDNFLRNLNQENISGISSMIFNLEVVLFSPWYFYGFRFAPFAYADMGLISNSEYAFTNNTFFSAIGAGFRIRNESLAFKTIILSFGYIPNTNTGTGDYFYNFYMGDDVLVPVLSVDRPYILRRDLILPY